MGSPAIAGDGLMARARLGSFDCEFLAFPASNMGSSLHPSS